MSATRVALIHPEGSNGLIGKEDITTSINRVPPIGLICLAAYIEAAGNEVKILDLYGGGSQEEQLKKIDDILDWKPDFIGFTSTTSSVLDAYEKTEYIKKKSPEVFVAFGGVHVSSLVEKALDRFPLVDYAIIGEGEIPFGKLVAGDEPSSIKGVVYKEGGQSQYSGPATDFVTLDDLPLPAYHLLENFPKEYKLPILNSPTSKGAPIITSRGCPYTCAYCDRSVYGRSFRSNTPAYVIRHMEHLYDNYGVTHFNIYDDLFTLKRKRVEELCDLLIDHPAPFTFNCAARIGHIGFPLLQSLKKGGCYSVSLGIESGDQELLDRHKTGVKLTEVKETVTLIHKAGLRAKGLFIMGLPGETPQTARKTKEYIKTLGLDEMNLAKFAPFPGSPAYADIGAEGELIDDWRRMNCLNFVYKPNAFKSWDQMDKIYSEVIMGFYGSFTWYVKVLAPTLIKHPHNLVTIVKNLPGLLKARRQFDFKLFAQPVD